MLGESSYDPSNPLVELFLPREVYVTKLNLKLDG